MKFIEKNLETQIVDKKSKFIANIFYVETLSEAEEKIAMIKKKYYDARHNCFAYRIFKDEGVIEKTSDDGEPSGTAGKPILDLLKGNDIINCVVIVTRYFGGILLGTGGLVRAYSSATDKAIKEQSLFDIEEGYEIEIFLSYSQIELFNYYCKINKINIIKKEFGENIKYIIEISDKNKEEICNNSEKNSFKIISSRIMSKKLIRKNY